MAYYDDILNQPVYGLSHSEKTAFLTEKLKSLTCHHYSSCSEYRRILNSFGITENDIEQINDYCDLPFLPVRLFKEYQLKSVSENEIFKTMTSSGTTGQQVSRIFLDKETSSMQTKTLTYIMNEWIGKKRLPMIILDSSSVIKDRKMFSARGAGILGFQMFGSDKLYALDENMKLDLDGLQAFIEKHKGEQIFIFGFTFMIWQHFYQELKKSETCIDLSNAFLLHGGGWKKLIDQKVSSESFRNALKSVCGISRVHDYYGMVEQTGSIYMECECGHLHASSFSDVIVRDPFDFSVCPAKKKGIIQVVSVLPYSYPGHSLLTEDEGMILGEDDCPCGRKGVYFEVSGRLKNAEIRGCSDTYASKF